MMDYFSRIEQELTAAMRHGRHRPWYGRPRRGSAPSRARRPLIVLIACLVLGGSALAATGIFREGAPVRSGRPNPIAGSGAPARGGVSPVLLTAEDPSGGPPWGIRAVRTTRGLICLQVGRVQAGRLGALGIDGAFGGDGRFHAIPSSDLPQTPGAGPGVEPAAGSSSCHLPSDSFAEAQVGVPRSAAPGGGGARAQLRDLYFGRLGPQAVSVTYRAAGRTVTEPVAPGLGVYLVVLPVRPGEQTGVGSGVVTSLGGVYPGGSEALSAITYRFNGRLCRRLTPGHRATDECGEPGALSPPASLLPARRDMHVPLRVRLGVAHGVVRDARVSFRAPFGVRSAAQRYELLIPDGPCHGGLAGGASATAIERDIAPRSAVSGLLQLPFANLCPGERSIRVEAVYHDGVHRPVRVGTSEVRLPPGARGQWSG
jgi:hypothetical protein